MMLNPNTALLTVKHFTMYTEAKEVQRILPYYLASVHTGAHFDVLHRTLVEQIRQSVPGSLQAGLAEPRSGDPSFQIKEMLLFCLILLKNYSDHYIHNYQFHLIIITIIIPSYPHHHYHPYPHRHHHHALGISKQACKFTVRWKETV